MKDFYKNRHTVIQVIIAVFAVIFVIRLAYLQLIDKKYVLMARNNAIKEMEVYPTRGMVYDRNGKLIVYNEAIYDIMIVPRLTANVDSARLCELLDITLADYSDRKYKAKKYSPYKSSFFMKQVSMATYSRFQEFLYLFPGFYGQVRTIRKYPYKCGALVMGDIGEVDAFGKTDVTSSIFEELERAFSRATKRIRSFSSSSSSSTSSPFSSYSSLNYYN